MIYGNKLLNSDNLAIVALEQDILNIHESLKYFDNDLILNESAGDIIGKVFNKIKEVLIKILDAVSKLFKKVLPFIYTTIQKLITKIKNSMKDSKFAHNKYEGKKEFTILTLNDKIDKVVSDAKSAHFEEDIKMMEDIHAKYFMCFNKGAKNIADAIKEINPMVIKFNESIKKKLEPFEYILSLETFKEYYDKKEYTVESAIDYDEFGKMLEAIIDDNISMTKEMKEMDRSLGSLITTLNLDHLANKIGIGTVLSNDDIIRDLDTVSLSKVPRVYSKILDVYMGAIKSEIKSVNEISKFGRYDIAVDTGDITKFTK